MKVLPSQLAYVFEERQMRRNLRALLKALLFIVLVIAAFTVLFHYIMWNVEGQRHSWITGLYWTLTVMSTLGFGDITFTSDIGRLFSVVVLVSGVMLILVVLPFAFIRFFYAPWLEAQVRTRAPRALPESTEGHVLITQYDSIAPGLMERLELQGIPHWVIEPDPERAARLYDEGVPVVSGALDSAATYENLRVRRARLVLANGEEHDTLNTNIILTVRDMAPDVPVAAVAASEDSSDLMELAGATHVLTLKQRLGTQLANRINARHAQAHVIGSFRDLVIAEVPVHNTPLVGKTIAESGLRETTGLNVVGVWEQARLLPVEPDTVLTDFSLPVVVGSEEQVRQLDELLLIYDTNYNPVLVVGGGKVGRAAARSLADRGIAVHVIEKKEALRGRIEGIPDRLFIGDAADRDLLMEAGLADAPSVLLTTNDDQMNIYLAVYCRRLNPDLRIVSRLTHEHNVLSMQRAGADLVLSYASLGVEAVHSLLEDRRMVMLGEGVELHHTEVPGSLEGETLAESGIGAETGLNVVAIDRDEEVVSNPGAATVLPAGADLVMIGSREQLESFREIYG